MSDEEACMRAFTMSFTQERWHAWKKAWETALAWERNRVMERELEEMDRWHDGHIDGEEPWTQC